jgi:hypothetical protein
VCAVETGQQALQTEVGAVKTGQQALQSEVLALKDVLAADDASSWMSPSGVHYEDIVNERIDGWLSTFCGLAVLHSGRRGISATDEAASGQQWDARFSVLLAASWSPPPPPVDSSLFYVYGGGSYSRPDLPPTLRRLSPTKASTACDAHYFAVLEFTCFPDWTRTWVQTPETTQEGTGQSRKSRKALPPRLETRLRLCLERFKAAKNDSSSTVLDAVALVGVVSEAKCHESMEALLASPTCPWPLLKKMHEAKRFVFFYCFAASPRARVVVRGAEAGHGGQSAAAGGAGAGSP